MERKDTPSLGSEDNDIGDAAEGAASSENHYENTTYPDFSAQWDEITSHLSDVDRTIPGAGAGPRDWEPPTSPDAAFEPFDPEELSPPPPSPLHPTSHQIVLGLAVGLTLAALAMAFGLISLPSSVFGVTGVGALIATAAAIFLYLPHDRDPDDDGALV